MEIYDLPFEELMKKIAHMDEWDKKDILMIRTYMKEWFGIPGDPNNSNKQYMAQCRALYSFSFHCMCYAVGMKKEIRFWVLHSNC